jgi:uncharacterized protein (DUF697 family)
MRMLHDAVVYKETVKRILQGDFEGASEEEKRGAVKNLTASCTAAATVIVLQPVPALDVWLLLPVHIGLVQGIAHIRGYHLDKKSVLEILRTIRQSLLVQHVTIAGAKLVPGIGWLVAIAAANALTYALGEVSDFYFRRGRSMLPSELRAMLDRTFKERFARVYREKQEQLLAKLWRRRDHPN